MNPSENVGGSIISHLDAGCFCCRHILPTFLIPVPWQSLHLFFPLPMSPEIVNRKNNHCMFPGEPGLLCSTRFLTSWLSDFSSYFMPSLTQGTLGAFQLVELPWFYPWLHILAMTWIVMTKMLYDCNRRLMDTQIHTQQKPQAVSQPMAVTIVWQP